MDPLVDDTDPAELLGILTEGDNVVTMSLLDPDISSARKSEDEDDGARVPMEDPTR